MSETIRTRALAAIFAVTIGALLLAAGPAQATTAAPQGAAAEVCWLNADTDALQCFADEEAFTDAVAEQTGGALVEGEAPLAARSSSAGLLTTYVLARLYENTNYLNASYVITSTSSTTCTTGSGISGNLPAAWNDRVSSFRSYLSCSTRIYTNANQGGTWFGYSINAATVGALNDQASSYKLI